MRNVTAPAGTGTGVFPLSRMALLLAWFCCPLGGPGRAQAGIVDRVTVDKVTGQPQYLTPLAFTVHGRAEVRPDDLDVDFGNKTYVYQWPGIYFRTAFAGSELFFRTEAGKHQILHLTIDGQAPLIVSVDGAAEYRVHGLRSANHAVLFQVVTELQAGPAGFGGFALPSAEHGLAVPSLNRQIEFIGDSHTVGYGNTSPVRACSQEQIWSSTDNSKTFGALVADHFRAEYQVNAISGRGVVRNYNGFAGDTIPAAYPFILFDKQTRFVSSTWHPQVIVIALGTNDFSTPLNPGEPWKTRDELHNAYEAGYVRFIESLRARNPAAHFVLWATDGAAGEIQAEVQKVVRRLSEEGETRVHFIPVNGLAMTACDGHPSLADDRSIAEKLDGYLDTHPEFWLAQ